MLNSPDTYNTGLMTAFTEQERRNKLPPPHQADVIAYDWAQIGLGIVLAGGAYPIVLETIVVVIGSVTVLFGALSGSLAGRDIDQAVGGLFLLAGYALSGALIGIAYSGFVAALTLPLTYLVVCTLQLRSHIVHVGAFAGGLVGFIAILPLTLRIGWDFSLGDIGETALLLTLGPGLTTVLGQLGGAWGGSKSRELGPDPARNRNMLAKAGRWDEPPMPPAAELAAAIAVEHSRPFQFSIRHLLWAAVWLSLLLSVIRLSGVPFELALPLLAGWLMYQTVTMRIGHWFFSRRRRRRQAGSVVSVNAHPD